TVGCSAGGSTTALDAGPLFGLPAADPRSLRPRPPTLSPAAPPAPASVVLMPGDPDRALVTPARVQRASTRCRPLSTSYAAANKRSSAVMNGGPIEAAHSLRIAGTVGGSSAVMNGGPI